MREEAREPGSRPQLSAHGGALATSILWGESESERPQGAEGGARAGADTAWDSSALPRASQAGSEQRRF